MTITTLEGSRREVRRRVRRAVMQRRLIAEYATRPGTDAIRIGRVPRDG